MKTPEIAKIGMKTKTKKMYSSHEPKKVLEYIIYCWEFNNLPPSLREICIACGISSTCAVQYILKGLAKEGKIILLPNVCRGIIPTGITISVSKSEE